MASELLYLRDYDAKPCQNFFKYACGGTETQDLEYFEYACDKIQHLLNTSNDEYLINYKNFYSSCVEFNSDISLRKRYELCKYFQEEE